MEKFLRSVEAVSIIVTVIGSIVVSLLSVFVQVPQDVLLGTVLGLLGTFSLYQFSSNVLFERSLSAIKPEQRTLSHQVTQDEWYEQLIPVVKSARKTIDITHHEPRVPVISGIPAKRELFRVLSRRMKDPNVLVRWIVAIDNLDKLEWVCKLIEDHKDCPNFSLHYSHFDPEREVPVPSIQVIDRRIAFVIDLTRGHHSASELDLDLVTTDPAVIAQLQRAYDRYWERTIPLKTGARIFYERIDELRNILSQSTR